MEYILDDFRKYFFLIVSMFSLIVDVVGTPGHPSPSTSSWPSVKGFYYLYTLFWGKIDSINAAVFGALYFIFNAKFKIDQLFSKVKNQRTHRNLTNFFTLSKTNY